MSVALGVVALTGAIIPFYAALPAFLPVEAAVIGVLGVAAATAGLAHARRAGWIVSAPAVFGAVASGLSVVVGVTALIVNVISVRVEQRRPTLDTATVLSTELQVTLGTFSYTGSGSDIDAQLAVTMRNKLNKVRWFRTVVAAFDRDRHQVMSYTYSEVLAANATESVETFGYVPDVKTAERLKNSTFRIIDAISKPVT